MKQPQDPYAWLASLALLAGFACLYDISPKAVVAVDSGIATFEAPTNVPGISVRGRSDALKARAEVTPKRAGLLIHRIEASVPVSSLGDRMKAAGRQIRKSTASVSSGGDEELTFSTSESFSCPVVGDGQDFSCQVTGMFSMYGKSWPLRVALKVRRQAGAAQIYKAQGEGVVKLDQLGITPVPEFGVTPANDVMFHMEFVARTLTATALAPVR